MEKEQEFNIIQAILSIRPEADFIIGGNFDYASLKWKDKTQEKPTEQEFNDVVTAWNVEDQLDKIYHDGIDRWKSEMIQPVKDKFPKG
jgi:hypothetical protein